MVHMLRYQHSWSQQGQKKAVLAKGGYKAGRKLFGLHERPEKGEEREINEGGQRSDGTGIFLFGQLSLHAADILDKADNRGE